MKANIHVISASNKIDTKTGLEIRFQILDLMNHGISNILLDTKDVSFIDSSGLGQLIASFKECRAHGLNLSLCSLPSQAKALFEITGMDRVFNIFESQEEFFSSL